MKLGHKTVMNDWKSWLQCLPIPICGLTLGLAAVGNLFGSDFRMLHWSYLGMAIVLWLLLLLKLLLCWPQVRQEMQSPLTLSVFEAFFMTLLQVANATAVSVRPLALVLWWVANMGHIVLVITFSWRFLRHFQLRDVYTSWNVLYGGNLLAAVVASQLNMMSAGWWIFWVGVFLWLPWYPISVYRYWKLPVAEAAQPTLCILAAPFSLFLVGYLSAVPQPDWRLAVLTGCIAQTMYGYVLWHLPRILRLPFYPSYGALAFPFVIPTVALQKLLTFLAGNGVLYSALLHTLVLFEQGLAIILVTYVLLRYLQFLWQKRPSCGGGI